MKKIKLTQGQVALVDDEDYEWLNKHKWYAHKGKNTFYAARGVSNNTRKDGRRIIKMHRIILGVKKGQLVDHADRNGLNNQRKNLRIASHSLNGLNRGIRKDNTSGFKGVCWCKRRKRWVVHISINNKRKHLGYFDTVKEASAVYQKAYKERMKELTS